MCKIGPIFADNPIRVVSTIQPWVYIFPIYGNPFFVPLKAIIPPIVDTWELDLGDADFIYQRYVPNPNRTSAFQGETRIQRPGRLNIYEPITVKFYHRPNNILTPLPVTYGSFTGVTEASFYFKEEPVV